MCCLKIQVPISYVLISVNAGASKFVQLKKAPQFHRSRYFFKVKQISADMLKQRESFRTLKLKKPFYIR